MILAEPVERKFLKALKNSDIEALDFASQLDEGVREGWITADERKQLEELREMTIDAISVDDFDTRGAALGRLSHAAARQPRRRLIAAAATIDITTAGMTRRRRCPEPR